MAALAASKKKSKWLRRQLDRLQRIVTWPSRSPSFGLTVGLTVTSLVVIALLYVWSRLEVIRIGYELSQQSKLARALGQHNQRLRLELATRKDPATIERFARERLHMAPPQPSAIRIVKAARPSPSTSPGNTPR
ncbi:MAG: cell division protein FtsL [Deltaproteobacteria bacterium]|jgi:cell division protein FtsL|nr:cell division protein FtsL [Deltaproteobacteria bacterium]